MGNSHPAHRDQFIDAASTAARGQAMTFLAARLSEDLAQIWARGRPGMPAQVAIVDELLTTLAADRLPPRHELRMLLLGYGSHPEYDPLWTDLLVG